MLVEERALRRDSGGAGKYRGGLGIDMRVRNFVDGKWNFERARRRDCPAWGLWGGKPGEVGGYYLRKKGETEYRGQDGSHRPVPAGSQVIVRTGGGGGWGGPLERDPEAVRDGVMEEFISAQAAREQYGVVLRDNLAVDDAATAQTRTALRSQRESGQRGAKA